MLTMLGTPRRTCDGITRRETLRAGALSVLGAGFGLPNLLRAEEGTSSQPPGKAKSVIVLYLLGGAATQDMWDLKPSAPAEVRGEFKPIATSAPGILVCEHLPKMARWMHKAAIVRSVNHKAGCHNPLPSYTGHEIPLPDIISTRDTYPPSIGSVCEYMKNSRADHPDYVYMPCYLGWGQAIRRPGPYAGFLGKRFDPLFTEVTPYTDKERPAAQPGAPQPVRGEPFLPDSSLTADVTIDRFDGRRTLLQQIDDRLRDKQLQPAVGQFDRTRQRAFDILTSRQAKEAFDLGAIDPKVLDRYGRTLFGNTALIARRLVQAGVRCVNVTWDLYWDRLKVNYDAWDTHTHNFPVLKNVNLPDLDTTFSALMHDLDEQGLLDETLVVVMSEMGRTPRINANGGRDHWTFCYSVLFAGAGVRGGTVYGVSDAQAAYVKDKPASTGDICATIYKCLGIDPEMTVPDRSGRPVPVANGGSLIRDILT